LVVEIQKGILLYSCHTVRKFLNIDTEHNKIQQSQNVEVRRPVIMLNSTALLLDSNIRNSVCTPAKLPCRRVVEGSEFFFFFIKNTLLEILLRITVVVEFVKVRGKQHNILFPPVQF
jgi:hypothetical protein